MEAPSAALPIDLARPRVRLPRALALTAWLVGVAAVVALRSPGVPIWDTVWAEDGTVFLQAALDRSLPGAAFDPYAGYLHVPARVLAELALLFAPEQWALVLAVLSTGLAAVGGAYVYVASRSVLSTRWARALAAGLPWLVVAGEEVPANVANLHWYGLYVAFWALLARPATRRGLAAAGAVLLLVALSDPLVALGLPLAVAQARALHGPLRRRLAVLAPMLLGLAAQALAIVSAQGPQRFSAFHAGDAAGIYGRRVAGGALLGDDWFQTAWGAAGWTAIWVALGVAVLAVAAAARHHPGVVLPAAAGSVLLFIVPLALRGTAELDPAAGALSGSRYMLVPVLLLLVALVAGIDRAGGRRARQAFTLALVAVAVSGLGTVTSRTDGPGWTAGLQHARTACAHGASTAVVPIPPTGRDDWRVTLDCGRLAHR